MVGAIKGLTPEDQKAIKDGLDTPQGGGRHRSKRRHPKKSGKRSKKCDKKSKKGGRSRKNGSKGRKHSRAHKKH